MICPQLPSLQPQVMHSQVSLQKLWLLQELYRPLELALQLGLQHPPLAARTLKALERLEAQSPAALQALAPDLVPLLEPYLAPVGDIVAAALPTSAENAYVISLEG